jgi:hypothetical protein
MPESSKVRENIDCIARNTIAEKNDPQTSGLCADVRIIGANPLTALLLAAINKITTSASS